MRQRFYGSVLLGALSGCVGVARAAVPAKQAATARRADAAVRAAGSSEAWCYVARRREPAASFAGCTHDEASCRAMLEPRREMMASQGAVLESECARSTTAQCAVALDASGHVTFRSCAPTAALCDEQQRRAAALIARGMIQGSPPTCRPATREDLEHRAADRAPGAVGP